jgi:hypothetical protein
MAKRFPLSIVIGTIDRATGPLARVTSKIDRMLLRMGAPMLKVQRSLGNLARAAKFDRVTTAFGQLNGKVRDLGRSLASTATRMLVLGGVAAGLAAKLLHGYAEAGDAAIKTAQKLGVGVEWFQEWNYAAGQSGLESERFAMGLKTFSKNAADAAAGMGRAVPAFNALGVQLRDQSGATRPLNELYEETFAKLGALEDASLRNALAARMFGEAGLEMGPMLLQGAKGVDALRARARELGIVLSEDAALAGESFLDTVDDLKGAFAGARNAFLGAALPVITGQLQRLTTWISQNQDKFRVWGAQLATKLPKAIERTGAALRGLWDATAPIRSIFNALSERFGAANVAAVALSAVLFGKLVLSIAAVGSAFLKFSVLLAANPLGAILLGIGAIIAGLIYFRGNIADFGNWLLKWGGGIAGRIGSVLGWPFLELPGIVARAVVGVGKWIGGLFSKIAGVWPNLGTILAGPFFYVKDFVGGVVGWISDKIDSVFGWISDKVSALTGWLPDWVKNRLGLGGDLDVQIDDRKIARSGATTSTVRQEAAVRVEFANAPRGARIVERRSDGIPLDLSMGYSMTTPG